MIESFQQRFRDAWRQSDRILELVPRDAWLEQPIALRHPILFYVGHLPAFAWNQVGRGLLGRGHLHPSFDDLFERGIDPLDTDRHDVGVRWPAVDDVLSYRDRTRERLLELVPAVAERAETDPMAARGRILNVVLEHEAMHQETLLYMLARLPEGVLQRPEGVEPAVGAGAAPGAVEVEGGEVVLGGELDELEFGWDNEIPSLRLRVESFAIDRTPVRVADYLEFVESGGYRHPVLWLDEDWRWRTQADLDHPVSWVRQNGGFSHRWLFGRVSLDDAAHWPASVSLAEARAFCRWRGVRLPTEAELHHALYGDPDGEPRPHPWGEAAPTPGVHGSFGLFSWSPTPVGAHPAGASAWGLLDGIGNGWQWTSSPFAPFPGFEPYISSYPGYSADFFDDRHFLLLGASWATPTPLVRRSFRNWFQDRYPYVFSSFRTVR